MNDEFYPHFPHLLAPSVEFHAKQSSLQFVSPWLFSLGSWIGPTALILTDEAAGRDFSMSHDFSSQLDDRVSTRADSPRLLFPEDSNVVSGKKSGKETA